MGERKTEMESRMGKGSGEGDMEEELFVVLSLSILTSIISFLLHPPLLFASTSSIPSSARI
jgi:hypothetical protein